MIGLIPEIFEEKLGILRFVIADSVKEVYYRYIHGEGVPPELLFLRCFCIETLKK